MDFDFEKELRKVVKRQVAQIRLRDPSKEKLKDHRRRNRGSRFGKLRKDGKVMENRSFRRKNNHFCNKLIKIKRANMDKLIESVN